MTVDLAAGDVHAPRRATEGPARGGPAAGAPPVSIALVNDFEVVVRGLYAMLAPFADRVRIVELEVAHTPARAADIALFDTFGGRRDPLERAAKMIREGIVDHVVLYTWDAAPELVAIARSIGVSAVILKSAAGEELVAMLARVRAGERLGLHDLAGGTRHRPGERAAGGGLSTREREVLALVAQGLTNRAIADELFLSPETVKTYVRRLFSKLGVRNRTQAALRAELHGVHRGGGPREGVTRLGSVETGEAAR